MIWTENWNQRPAGDMVGTTTIGGKQYQVWRSGSGDGGILTYVSVTPQLSGTMPLAILRRRRARGWTDHDLAGTAGSRWTPAATRSGSTSPTTVTD
jgi:hypothetical protein